jgi:uncharacterized protein
MRLFITAILLCSLPFLGFAQVKTTSKKSVTQLDQPPNSVLWEISGNGLEKPSYLFGTMHILCAQDALLSDSLQFSIDRASQVYFEVDMDNMAELMGLFKYIKMKDNKTLSDLITPAEYDRVKKYFAENRSILPLSMMERFKPYFIASILSESKMPCETKNGMEEVIMQEVKKQQKEINGLESIAFQASIFDSIPYEEQAQELLRTIDSAGVEDSMTQKMLDVYRSQNLAEIEKLTLREEGGVAAYLDLFLYGRNAKWIPLIETAMKKGSTLFAVGAAHLPGGKGVIQLLQNAGYRLRPMKHSVNQRIM